MSINPTSSPVSSRTSALRAKALRAGPLAAAVLGLVVVSGSTGAVAGGLITGEQIKNRSISNRDLATNAVNSRIVADGSLEARDLSRATLRALTPATPAPGAPGSAWLSGAGAPTSVDANDGDWYFDTETSSVYTRVGGAWGFVVDLTGAQGIQGIQGIQGEKGATGAQGEKGETGAQGEKGETGAQGEKGETGETGAAGKDGLNGKDGKGGLNGKDGTVWSSGVGAPSSESGVVGDWYLDTETADAYQKTAADAWTKRVNLRGAKGEKGDAGEQGKAGIDGASWFTGAGAPAEALGSDGDLYLDTETGDVFKRKGLWAKLTNIRGLKGDPGKDGVDGKNGEKGANGTNGTNGAVWLTGAGAPEAAQGVDGDLYLRTSNGDVFKKAAGSWGVPIANLTGPAGPKGTDGTSAGGGTTWVTGAGAPSPQSTNPVLGALYLDTTSGAVYKADGTAWAAIYTPAAAGAPIVQVDAKPSTNQPISSRVDGSTSTLVSFGAANDQRASLTNGNTFNGNTFKVGNGGAGWYEVRAESRGVTSSGGLSSNFPILYLDVNDAMGNTNTGAAAIGTYDSVLSHTAYRGHSVVARTVYLKAGDTVQIQAVAASSSMDAYTSTEGLTYLQIVRLG